MVNVIGQIDIGNASFNVYDFQALRELEEFKGDVQNLRDRLNIIQTLDLPQTKKIKRLCHHIQEPLTVAFQKVKELETLIKTMGSEPNVQ